jgi:hypothetical protein
MELVLVELDVGAELMPWRAQRSPVRSSLEAQTSGVATAGVWNAATTGGMSPDGGWAASV